MNVVIPEIGMTSLSGLMSVRLSHQEAPAQQPAGTDPIRVVKAEHSKFPAAKQEEEALWVQAKQDPAPRPAVGATPCVRGGHGIP